MEYVVNCFQISIFDISETITRDGDADKEEL